MIGWLKVNSSWDVLHYSSDHTHLLVEDKDGMALNDTFGFGRNPPRTQQLDPLYLTDHLSLFMDHCAQVPEDVIHVQDVMLQENENIN